MDFMAMLMGGTALQGILGGLGSIFGSNSQSKSIDKAMQFQMQQQAMAMQLQKEMLEQAKAQLLESKGAANNLLQTGMESSRIYNEGKLGEANLLEKGGLADALLTLDPYAKIGEMGTNALTSNYDYLTKPFTMDQAALEATPGYKFALEQGLRAQQQSATTRGLGLSGAQLKGAADFATGLADQTYGNQFQRELTQRNDLATRIGGYTGIGQGAAGAMAGLQSGAATNMANRTMGVGTNIGNQVVAGTAQQSGNEMDMARILAQLMFGTGANIGAGQMQLGGSIGNLLLQQGNAQAGGIMGAANALGGAGSNLSNMLLMQQLFGGGNPFGAFSTTGAAAGKGQSMVPNLANAFGQYTFQ